MRKILLFLGVLLLTLGLVVGSVSAVLTVVTDAGKTFIDWQSGGVSVFKIDDTDGVTITGAISGANDILMATTKQVQFYDTGLYIGATANGALAISSDGTLAVGATTSYTLTSPTVEFVATTITLDAATSISLEAGAGTFDLVATGLEMNALTIMECGDIDANDAAGPSFLNEAATASNPTLCPNKVEDDTGIGWQSDVLHIVLGGVNEYNFAGAAFITSTNDGAALGTATYMWSDLFLAEGAVINFNAGNFTITHSAGLLTLNGAVTVGASATGADVTFYGDIADSSCVWDATANTLKLFTTYTADAQIETYDARIDATTTYNTAITTGKFAQGIYIGVGGTGDVDSGGFLFPLWIDSSGTGTNNGTYYMARFSVQSGGLLPNTYIQFQTASPGVEYLFALDGNVAPYATGGTDCTTSGATSPKGTIAVRLPDGNAGYIRVWTAK